MDRGAWQAVVCGVTKSWTWLSTHTQLFHGFSFSEWNEIAVLPVLHCILTKPPESSLLPKGPPWSQEGPSVCIYKAIALHLYLAIWGWRWWGSGPHRKVYVEVLFVLIPCCAFLGPPPLCVCVFMRTQNHSRSLCFFFWISCWNIETVLTRKGAGWALMQKLKQA